MEATAGIVHRYEYTYGAGSDINRRVYFIRPHAGSEVVSVLVLGLFHGQWVALEKLDGNRVTVEMESTTNKFSRMLSQRSGKKVSPPEPDCKLSALPISQQEDVLKELEQRVRRMEILNCPGGNYGMEKVEFLKIFDPR